MHSATVTINKSGKPKELSYTCFPVKLFRIVSNEKYTSLWWSECGTHLIVDVPKFEQEILRNDSVPQEDGFKTITFTSFIRQLNLYGFRKVSVDNSCHFDPRDWQRYAHTFFLRVRPDFLDRIRRQTGHCTNRVPRNAQFVDTLQGYNAAMTHHFRCRGIRPSRKGPKTLCAPPQQFVSDSTSRKRRRKQVFPSQATFVQEQHTNPHFYRGFSGAQPFMGHSMVYTPQYQQFYQHPVMVNNKEGFLWQNMPRNGQIIHQENVQRHRPSARQLNRSNSMNQSHHVQMSVPQHNNELITVDADDLSLLSDQWQDLGLNFSSQFRTDESNKENAENEDPNSRQFYNMTSNSIPGNTFSPFGDSSRKLLSRGGMRVPHDPPICQVQQRNPMEAASSQFDAALNAAVLADGDLSPTHYCVIGDESNMSLWSDDGEIQGSDLLADPIFMCGG